MQNYRLTLTCEPSDSFKCTMAANSLDINIKEKLTHEFSVSADFDSDYNVGLIVGNSGSGKSTFAKHVFGEDACGCVLDDSNTLLDQMPVDMPFKECADILNGVGLSSVPCWIRPVKTLSTGQRFRASVAVQIAYGSKLIVIDEWTSVIDRDVAKIMSHNIQKYIRKLDEKIVLISCHYDVIEWLNPCWVVDCNEQKYIDRRRLRQDFVRKDRIKVCVRECSRASWSMFSKYHYLSKALPGGKNHFYGLFIDDKQIGFQAFSNYIPKRKGKRMVYHASRIVIHPDYCGIGLGAIMVSKASQLFMDKMSGLVRVLIRASSTPMFRSLRRCPCWAFEKSEQRLKQHHSKQMFSKRAFVRMFLCEFYRSLYKDGSNIASSCEERVF